MQKLSKLGRILSLVFLSGALWLVYTILVFSFEENANTNTSYIPSDAKSVYRLDGRVLTRELLASLLISEDEDLKQMAQSQIPTTEEGRLKPVGISFDSDIILFRTNENGTQLTGFLFNLWDQRIFDKNIPKYLGKNGASASSDEVGLLLLQVNGNLTQKELQQKAKKILAKPSDFIEKHPAPENKSLISIWYQEGNSAISDVGISVQDNQLMISGNFKTNADLKATNLAKYKGGFHIHSQWFPEVWSELIQKALNKEGIEIPPVQQFSMNYFGTTIVTEPNIVPLPVIAGAIEFKEGVNVDSLFKKFTRISFDSIQNIYHYDVLGKKYAITQTDNRTLHVQSQDDMELTNASISSVAEISGNPKYLLNINGDDFISRILVLSPEYRAVSSLVKEITAIDIKMTPASKNTYRIYGRVSLQDDKWPLNELLKFLIRSKLL